MHSPSRLPTIPARLSHRNVAARRLSLEQLEPRLALTWAGVAPVAIAIPTGATNLALDAQNDASGTASITRTEVDYYTFTAPTSGTYTLSATTPLSSVDTVLGVFSATGARLASNDDISAGNTDSRVQVSLTAGTTVYVGVTNYASWSRGAYSWSVDGPATQAPDDFYENNDTAATSYNLGTLTLPTTLSGLALLDNADWFSFTTAAAGTAADNVSIAFQNAQGNLDLSLYNAVGTRVGVSQGVGNAETISLNGLPAGTYSLRVTGSNTGIFNASYSLSITPPTTTTGTPGPVAAFPDVANYGTSNDWNLNSINAPEVWAQGYTGQGIVVAVVDTGVDLDHADLDSHIWVNTDEIGGNGIDDDHNGYVDDTTGWDFASGDNNPNDQNGHGTHVAGTIAAERNGVGATGVAPDATIMPVRVLGSNGSGSDSSVAAGIRYAAQNGANIINLSLGGAFSTVIQTAIQYAAQLNVLVIVAAGNESASTPSYPARFSATLDNVISVGAYSSSNAMASFSNDVGNSGAVQVDAPGVNVYSTYIDGRYAVLSGTSMATPQVAGLAALALSANHNLTAGQLRDLIVAGTDHTIRGSDSNGGIDAALTVAWAAAGQVSGSSAPQTATFVPQASIARLFLLSDTSDVGTSDSSAESSAVAAVPHSALTAVDPLVAALPANSVSRSTQDAAILDLVDESQPQADAWSDFSFAGEEVDAAAEAAVGLSELEWATLAHARQLALV